MTSTASRTLAAEVTDQELEAGLLFPSVARLRAVSFNVAVAVARQAVHDGVADVPDDAVERHVSDAIWEPDYPDHEPL
jgi:malate dehydrogenase (oxaloacetate-decarboxylating)